MHQEDPMFGKSYRQTMPKNFAKKRDVGSAIVGFGEEILAKTTQHSPFAVLWVFFELLRRLFWKPLMLEDEDEHGALEQKLAEALLAPVFEDTDQRPQSLAIALYLPHQTILDLGKAHSSAGIHEAERRLQEDHLERIRKLYRDRGFKDAENAFPGGFWIFFEELKGTESIKNTESIEIEWALFHDPCAIRPNFGEAKALILIGKRAISGGTFSEVEFFRCLHEETVDDLIRERNASILLPLTRLDPSQEGLTSLSIQHDLHGLRVICNNLLRVDVDYINEREVSIRVQVNSLLASGYCFEKFDLHWIPLPAAHQRKTIHDFKRLFQSGNIDDFKSTLSQTTTPTVMWNVSVVGFEALPPKQDSEASIDLALMKTICEVGKTAPLYHLKSTSRTSLKYSHHKAQITTEQEILQDNKGYTEVKTSPFALTKKRTRVSLNGKAFSVLQPAGTGHHSDLLAGTGGHSNVFVMFHEAWCAMNGGKLVLGAGGGVAFDESWLPVGFGSSRVEGGEIEATPNGLVFQAEDLVFFSRDFDHVSTTQPDGEEFYARLGFFLVRCVWEEVVDMQAATVHRPGAEATIIEPQHDDHETIIIR